MPPPSNPERRLHPGAGKAPSSSPAADVQRARQQEREHLARELHDVLGGELTAARLQLASLKARLAGQPADIHQRLGQLDATLAAALALKGRIIDGLDPASLRRDGLRRSLQAMIREFMQRSGIRVAVRLDEVAVTPTVDLVVYRLVQEALTNIGKRARASQAEVVLRDQGAWFGVSVRDNGQGFGNMQAAQQGHGLAGMRHRVEDVGGQLTVQSWSDGGTRIAATLPKSPRASLLADGRPG